MVWNSILFASDLRLYPVQEGQIIVDQKCPGNLPVQWDKSLSEATGGLKKTDELFALSKKGSTLLSVGDPSCFIGECKGNNVAVQLVGADREVFGAIKKTDGMRLKTVPVQVTSLDPKECTTLYPAIFDESFPEVPAERKCQNVSVQNFPQFTIATKGFKQENGWVVYVVHAQTGQSGTKIEIDRDTNPLEPVLGIVDSAKRVLLLWKKSSGICCPSETTLVLSTHDDKGVMSFGERYKAGGQPCD